MDCVRYLHDFFAFARQYQNGFIPVEEKIEIEKYSALVMNVQGTELLALKCARDLPCQLKFIKLEVPDFGLYEGCPKAIDSEAFLFPYGFREYSRDGFPIRNQRGAITPYIMRTAN